MQPNTRTRNTGYRSAKQGKEWKSARNGLSTKDDLAYFTLPAMGAIGFREPAGLGADFDRSPIGDGEPDFIHFVVGDGDAAIGPIVQPVGGANRAVAARQAVDEDVAAGGDAAFASCRSLRGSWIGNVERLVELALGVARIQNVNPFRGLVVSPLGLRSDGGAAESYFVFFGDSSMAQEPKDVFVFQDQDAIGFWDRDALLLGLRGGWEERQNGENRKRGMRTEYRKDRVCGSGIKRTGIVRCALHDRHKTVGSA
jgi:hypothetical protein